MRNRNIRSVDSGVIGTPGDGLRASIGIETRSHNFHVCQPRVELKAGDELAERPEDERPSNS